MVHCHKKFNRIQDPENKIPANEPVFLLRAQDELAIPTLKFYIEERLIRYGQTDKIAADLYKHLEAMREWPKKKKAD